MRHIARKRFGQNFLHDQQVIDRIIASIAPRASDLLVEIGPGRAALTRPLIGSGAELHLIELDRDLVAWLEHQFSTEPRLTIHSCDALRADLPALTGHRPFRLIGNLPYNISTPLIFHVLQWSELVIDMHFMLQKEVVDRLASEPGTSDYGRLGIMTQYFCRVDPLFLVPPSAFNPAPKVDSAIVRLTPYRTLPHPAKDVRMLQDLLRTAFSQRRKTLRNNLRTLLDADALTALEIDPGLRPERLTLAEFVRISDYLSSNESEHHGAE